MATARAFSTLYDLVGKNCQDESTSGDTDAKNGINEVIKQLTAELDLPPVLLGDDGTLTVTPAATTGPATLTLSGSVKSVVAVWYAISGLITQLTEITSLDQWLSETDTNSDGDPALYRTIAGTGATAPKIQVWPGPSSSFISRATNIKYAAWGQLGQLSADADVPALQYEHDIVLVSGGTFYMAQKQGDSVLMALYKPMYETDKANIRAWATSRRYGKAPVVPPMDPLYGHEFGRESRDYGLR